MPTYKQFAECFIWGVCAMASIKHKIEEASEEEAIVITESCCEDIDEVLADIQKNIDKL